jgi:AmmeMemoRadiSam system protein B
MERDASKYAPIPRIREDLEVISTSYQGKKALVVRDFLGLIPSPILLQEDALGLLALIDGKRTVRDIQLEMVRLNKGVLVDGELIVKMVGELEAALLLQSRKYYEEKARLLTEYAQLEVRAASHAGVSYPADPKELESYLDSILNSAGKEIDEKAQKPVCALIAPHIDLDVGKRTYARAYGAIKDLSPRRVLLLGTGHSLGDGPYCLTEKDFETPIGRVRTDREAVRQLKMAGAGAVSRHDIAHRREHSLEFQILFLQRLFGSSFFLVPILCGPLSQHLDRVSRPSEIPAVGRFLAALGSLCQEDSAHTLVVAGVDFSHIGPKFGHRERATALLSEARDHDMRLIEALGKGDIRSFWSESRRARDRYNVCGLSALATVLEFLPDIEGDCLDYEFWQEEPTQSAVSYAAVVLRAA